MFLADNRNSGRLRLNATHSTTTTTTRQNWHSKWPNHCMVLVTKKLWPTPLAPGALPPNFTVSLFPHSHLSASFVQIHPGSLGDICKNIFQAHYNIGIKPVGLHADNSSLQACHVGTLEWFHPKFYAHSIAKFCPYWQLAKVIHKKMSSASLQYQHEALITNY